MEKRERERERERENRERVEEWGGGMSRKSRSRFTTVPTVTGYALVPVATGDFQIWLGAK